MLLRAKKTRYTVIPLIGLVITGAVFALLTLVRNQEPFSTMDKRWSQSLYQTKALPNPLMVLFTRLGSGFFTIPLGLMLFFSYKNTGEHDKSKLILFNVIGIRMLNVLFKLLFKRKPPKWERQIEASKYGYPSAHTMNAANFYGLLLFLSGLWKSTLAFFLSFIFLIMVGLSRVKLGIHFINDVLAGLAGGLFFNLLGIKSYKTIFKR